MRTRRPLNSSRRGFVLFWWSVAISATAPKAPAVQGGLLLDTREGLRKGGNSGAAVVPGNPEQSLLIKALRYKSKELQMPPGEPLTSEQVADFEDWVKMGAPDPRVPEQAKPSGAASTHWSFQQPRKVPLPATRNRAWAKNPIDTFVLSALEAKGLHPSAPADKRTLLRRATFDLIGLPPTPQETDAFLADQTPQAFARVVDRLLASPHYGERWGRHWLDVARYADTKSGRRTISLFIHLPRLGDSGLQRRHALRPVPFVADRRRSPHQTFC